MTLLLIDVGNTRIKWARWTGTRLSVSHARSHAGWSARDFETHLFGGRPVADTWVASVAGPQVQRALRAAARRSGSTLQFVRTPRRAGGVTVGYPESWRLGVDRFVALVGAHRLFPTLPLLVVGVGTAMTIDLVGADGRHRGGVIIPGPALMVDTLLTRTHGIRRRAQGGRGAAAGLFGRSTRAGIMQGSRYAAAALIDRSVDEARLLVQRKPLVLLMGGAADTVRPLLRHACVGVPDLTLRGLAVLAQDQPPGRRG
jgi:type III pantothenate kinase